MKIRALALGVIGAIAALGAVTALTARSGDPALWPPAPGAPVVEIHVVSHGYHSGVVLPREAIVEAAGRRGDAALIAVVQRFANFRWLELGWGDEEFYRNVPDAASMTFRLAVQALFLPGNASVVHVVGLNSQPRAAFPTSDIIPVNLSDEGFARLIERLDASFGRGPSGVPLAPLGQGLYGRSLFYRSVEKFYAFNVCNHWVARLLSAAGLPTAPVLATLPQGLFFDLKWRVGLVTLPKH